MRVDPGVSIRLTTLETLRLINLLEALPTPDHVDERKEDNAMPPAGQKTGNR